MFHCKTGHLFLASCLLLSFLPPLSITHILTEDKHLPDRHNLTENQGHPNQNQSNLDADSDFIQEEKDKKESNRQENGHYTVEYFLDALMTKYGDGKDMSFEGFEHLLNKLKLANILFIDHHLDCHKSNTSSEFISFHSNHHHSQTEKLQAPSDSQVNCPFDKSSHHTNDHELNSNKSQLGQSHNHSGEEDHKHNHDNSGEVNKRQSHNNVDESNNEDSHDEDEENHEHSQDHNDEKDHHHEVNDDHSHDHGDADDNSHDHEGDHDHSHDHEGDGHNHDHEGDDHGHNHEGDDHGHSHNHEGEDDHSHDHEGEDDHSHDHEGDGHNHDHEGDDHGHSHDHEGEDDHVHSHDHESSKATSSGKVRKHRTAGDDVHSKCLPPKMLLNLVNADDAKGLTKEMFARLCPALIYQIEQDSCHNRRTSHSHENEIEFSTSEETQSNNSLKVWGYSIIAVFFISLIGLVGVVLIPFMKKQFYNHLLQFLVALAIGAMSGDALLHLLPHAIAGGHGDEAGHGDGHGHGSHGDGSHGDGGHKHDLEPIYKGLAGLLGIYFFFLTERILTIFTGMKRRKKQKKNSQKKIGMNGNRDMVGKKLASNDTECDEMMMTICPNKALKGYADETHTEHCDISFSDTTTITHQHENHHLRNHKDALDDEESSNMITHNSNGHSHGHHHGHSHFIDGVPKSVSSIAWMVILGDGVHNFADGLAVGAAFSNSITGGFSTSIAVFCHELPHEIGDFAMLLRTGMSAKHAVIYSGISTLLCFAGLPVGIVLGNIQDASLWIFAIIGGMFLYIALVDMLPAMSSVDTKEGENPFFHLLLQLVGMLSGAAMMLVIALYEEDLKSVLH